MSETVTETPSSTPSETDYSQLIIADATPTTAPSSPEALAETEPEATVTSADEGTEPEQSEEAPKVDGTPDKWRQKVDQRMAEIEKLVAKRDEGTITPKEEQRLAVKKDELAEILEKGELADPLTAKRVLENEKKSGDETTALRKEISELREQNREIERRSTWRDEREKYPGVDVEKVFWPNAAKDATEQVKKEIELSGMADDFDDETVKKMCYARTRTLYESRAADALKSVKARNGKPEPSTPKTAPGAPSKPTPNGARVTVSGSSGGVPRAGNPNEITDSDYRNLIMNE